MTYPKWRHHPTLESKLVTDSGFEESLTPDADGWRNDRNFDKNDEPKPKGKPGPKPKVRE